jgi:hypothetical protein
VGQEHQRQSGGQGLGEGSQVKDGVQGHRRAARFPAHLPGRTLPQEFPFEAHHGHRGRVNPLIPAFFEKFLQARPLRPVWDTHGEVGSFEFLVSSFEKGSVGSAHPKLSSFLVMLSGTIMAEGYNEAQKFKTAALAGEGAEAPSHIRRSLLYFEILREPTAPSE